MKVSKRLATLLAFSSAALGLTAACGSSSNNNTTDSGAAGSGNDQPTYTGPQCDEPGGAQCTGSASGLVCPAGSTNAVEFVCASGEECKDGKCVGQCEGGDTECVGGSTMRVCAADGRSWVNVSCKEGEVCDGGKCGLEGGLVCTPGARECVGTDKARTCKGDGSGWEEDSCPGDTACSDGACRGSVCEVGATKCDDSTLDIPSAFYFEMNSEPNFGVVWKCTDGEKWEVEPCADTDTAMKACAYTGLDAAAVARYRNEAFMWLVEYSNANSNDLPAPPLPKPLEIPAGAKASCQTTEEEWQAAFFESATQSRFCGRPEKEGEEPPDSYTEFTQLNGYLPYQTLKYQTTACEGMTACGSSSRGCYPVECFPGEEKCADRDSLQYCYFDSSYVQNSYFQEPSNCPGEVASACVDTGKSPNRSVTCGGTPIDEFVK